MTVSPTAAAPPATGHALASLRAVLGRPSFAVAVTILGSIVLAIAGTLPVWGTRLVAPQYPKGLDLWFYGGRVEGPVTEVNNLNHYIGMQPIDLARVPEMQLWPLAIVSAAVLLAVSVLWRGWLSRFALLGLWLIPFVVLADIQRWLIIFSTELIPGAALSIGSFVPLVVGPTKIWNFSVLTYPGPALILIWLVALAATIAHRSRLPERRVRWMTAIGSIAVVAAAAIAFMIPPPTQAAGGAHADAHAAPPAGITDLGALIASAVPGSRVTIPAGTYHTHLVIDRPMELVAGGHVLLDGDGRGTVVTITADDVTFRGFHVRGTGGQGEEAAAIKVVDASRVTIEDNRIEDFFTGIATRGASDVRVVGNDVIGSGQVTTGAEHAAAPAGSADAAGTAAGGQAAAADHAGHGAAADGAADGPALPAAADPHAGHGPGAGPGGQGEGISLWNSRGLTVTRNTIVDVRDAVYLNYADRVLVDSNDIRTSRYAVHAMFGDGVTIFGNDMRQNFAGLVLMYTEDVLAGRNRIVDQRSPGTGYGVILKDVVGIRIAENVIARNRVGIKAEGTRNGASAEAVVLRNRIAANATGVSLMPTADIGFAANTFEDNLTDVRADEATVAQHNDWTYQGTGNHWSGYAGYDLDGDHVGDIPHVASGAVEVLVHAAPALELYRTSPALHALAAAQGLWEAGRGPVVRDHAPRLDDPAPRLDDPAPRLELDGVAYAGVASSSTDLAGWLVLGAVLAALAGVGIVVGRARGREMSS